MIASRNPRSGAPGGATVLSGPFNVIPGLPRDLHLHLTAITSGLFNVIPGLTRDLDVGRGRT